MCDIPGAQLNQASQQAPHVFVGGFFLKGIVREAPSTSRENQRSPGLETLTRRA